MIRVYVASAYTLGDREANVKQAMAAADELIRLGFAPFSPLLSHYQNLFFPQSYDTWLTLDMEWLRQCHCVYRIPGESVGADREVQQASLWGIPVFYDMPFFKEWSAKYQGKPEVENGKG